MGNISVSLAQTEQRQGQASLSVAERTLAPFPLWPPATNDSRSPSRCFYIQLLQLNGSYCLWPKSLACDENQTGYRKKLDKPQLAVFKCAECLFYFY